MTKGREKKPDILMHDRDTKFSRAFTAACKDGGLRTNPLPVAPPNLNGRCERFIQTMKHELLFKFILFGNRHVDYLVEQFLAYYNGQRAHMERENLPPLCTVQDKVVRLLREQIEVKSYVGGLVKSFERKAV